jgi:hypothetical protein
MVASQSNTVSFEIPPHWSCNMVGVSYADVIRFAKVLGVSGMREITSEYVRGWCLGHCHFMMRSDVSGVQYPLLLAYHDGR